MAGRCVQRHTRGHSERFALMKTVRACGRGRGQSRVRSCPQTRMPTRDVMNSPRRNCSKNLLVCPAARGEPRGTVIRMDAHGLAGPTAPAWSETRRLGLGIRDPDDPRRRLLTVRGTEGKACVVTSDGSYPLTALPELLGTARFTTEATLRAGQLPDCKSQPPHPNPRRTDAGPLRSLESSPTALESTT